MRIAVIGAGAFGGWTALFLRRLGHTVTLVDAWGPGNSRSSSGGETRIIRSIYGGDVTSTRMAARALALWKEHQQRWQTALSVQTGALFLSPKNDPYLSLSAEALTREGIAFERFTPAEAGRRYPQIQLSAFEAPEPAHSLQPVEELLLEPDAALLFARRNCRTVVEHFVGEGGEYLCAEARPNAAQNGRLIVSLHTGNILPADAYVFACGPWLGLLFPDVLGNFIRPTRQDVVFVGTPPGSTCFGPIELPCWIDRTSRLTFYGIPECEHRGLKIASDVRGPDFNPSTGDRIPAAAAWRDAQAYLTHRFPDLARAPLIETRVCQYEDSQDVAFILDRHPGAEHVWLVGGGSGHGYKHGPAVGELVADLVTGRQSPPAEFSLARFASGAPRQSRVSTI